MQYEIHRSEVPSSLAGILHCFAALSCLFLCLRCLSWISGSGGAPTWFGESTQYEIHRSEVPRSFAGILHCVLLPCCLFLPRGISGTVVQEGFQLDCNTAFKMKSWGLTCLSWISGSGGAPTWFEENTQYEIHRSEVPRSFAGILHCVLLPWAAFFSPGAFLEQWFRKGSNLIAIRLTRWNPGVWGIWRGSVVPEGFQLGLRKIRNMKSTGLRYQAAFFSPGAFLEQWFRKGSNLIAIRLTRWNPGVWRVCRGSVVPEGLHLDLKKACNMKSTGLRYQGLMPI